MSDTSDNGKTIAIISYITLIGWIIALIMHNSDKTELGAFHIRQTLGLMLSALILSWIPIVGWILSIVIFVFWIIGLVGACQGEAKPLPMVGEFFQNTFSFIE